MIGHIFATAAELPPLPDGILYQYVVAANGVFVRAERPGLAVLIWIAATPQPVRGLAELQPYCRIQRVPADVVWALHDESARALPNEILFYLLPDADTAWRVIIPEQRQTPGMCMPVDPYNPHAAQALIEAHSHQYMPAYFSPADNRDETGFKIYAVIGRIGETPQIRARVGVYGHHYEIPAGWVFDRPAAIADALYVDDVEMELI